MTDLSDLIAKLEAADTHDPPLVNLPHYTTSIDAALTLVPEGWVVSHAYWGRDKSAFCLTKEVGIYTEGQHAAATPALALCIAALKAREA